MKKVMNGLVVLAFLAVVSLMSAMNAQAGPMVKNLAETNLMSYPNSPFHLNTDRFRGAFQAIATYLSSHDDLSSSAILIADNKGDLLRGTVTDWAYYTNGTEKGIELYVYNPEDGSQFLTVDIYMPKGQQRNLEKKESYLTSFQQIENFLTGSTKYRMDLVFQDDVRLQWGYGYSFKLDDEGTSLSFAVNTAAHPKAKVHEVKEVVKAKSTTVSTAKGTVTPQATVSATVSITTTPTTSKKHKKSKSSASATAVPTAVPTAAASTDDSR